MFDIAYINKYTTGICARGIMGIMVPWNITRKAPYSRYRERDIAGDYGIGNFWFVVGKHSGDCDSWATAVVGWCAVLTSSLLLLLQSTLLHVSSAFLCVLANTINTSYYL